MSTKTISLKDEAYQRLKSARRYRDESFSEVVLRATWPEDTITAKELLERFATRHDILRPDELDRIEAAKHNSQPPEDKWAGR